MPSPSFPRDPYDVLSRDPDYLDALEENSRRQARDWLDPVGTDGTRRVLDPGFGLGTPALSLTDRVATVRAATGLPVALLDGPAAPRRITALTALVDGASHYAGTETRYPDGRSVRVHWPTLPPPAATAGTAAAVQDSGLFARSTPVVDGTPVEATGCRSRPGGPVVTRLAEAGGWLVSVSGQDLDGTRVRLVGADRAPGPGLPRTGDAT
ncbi:hypothetical protein PUR61_02070 [Streptomyces sp. BE20]|uniref:hypothetical protein n=1 Tax=Streptomyces sp. BE20 TaxID=3002525 RepID=UPI002E78B7AE|nr:hypothetical protein [Streptomyces sp. BE20]MEE1820993.1 hypothetical protein [Streptomyces sp. BE20]